MSCHTSTRPNPTQTACRDTVLMLQMISDLEASLRDVESKVSQGGGVELRVRQNERKEHGIIYV